MGRGLTGGLIAIAAAAGCALGCSNEGADRVGSSASAIQGGAPDAVHSFVVGIAQLSRLAEHEVVLCSGLLLAPNLVATARHCVVQAPTQIDCSASTFGDPVPTADLLVTNDPTLMPTSAFSRVTEIIQPSGSDQTKVCGNDVALLVLAQPIVLPSYVVPSIDPPMSDHSTYSKTIAAIGYGVDAPDADGGTGAGTRRIKENVALACVPRDSAFDDCLSQGDNSQLFTESEFLSGDASTCEGDSGSGAFDQSIFDTGRWVSFGVLSRGGLSDDGRTCIDPVYVRFDAWGQFLIDGAKHAAQVGGYPAPSWVNEQPLSVAKAGGCVAGGSEARAGKRLHLLELAILTLASLAVARRRKVNR